jgi:hypothetical protein
VHKSFVIMDQSIGRMIESSCGERVPGQRARLTVRFDQRRRPARLVQQVTDLAEVIDSPAPPMSWDIGSLATARRVPLD